MTEKEQKNSFNRQVSTEDMTEKYKAEIMKFYKKSDNYSAPKVIPTIAVTTPPADKAIEPQIIPNVEQAPLTPPIPPPVVQTAPQVDLSTNTTCEDENCGFLQVEVTTGKGAIPIDNAHVTVFKINGTDKIAYRFMTTDRNGETPTITLPAPSRALSEVRGNIKPYATYNIIVVADGFYRIENVNAPVFSTIKSILPVDLIPLAEFDENAKKTLVYNQP